MYRVRSPVIITNYSTYLRYINSLDCEKADRRLVAQTKYTIKVERFSGEKMPYKVLDNFVSLVKEGKVPQYGNFSYKFKDNYENLNK